MRTALFTFAATTVLALLVAPAQAGASGPGALSVNPEFVSSTDCHLASTSLMIDAGTSTHAPLVDFDVIHRSGVKKVTRAIPARPVATGATGATSPQGPKGDTGATGRGQIEMDIYVKQ